MKQLTVPKIAVKDPRDARELDRVLNALPRQAIAEVPWKAAYPYRPEVQFVMGYDKDHLYLKYYVQEKAIRAVSNQVNGKVWEDSCVEFFIAFDQSDYYNLEFNCIGTSLASFGPSKRERNHLPAPIVQQIHTRALINRLPGGQAVQWELAISIPLSTFIHHQPLELAGRDYRANFYKCGDLLPEPHFITWSGIETAEPNFHVPANFGHLHFE